MGYYDPGAKTFQAYERPGSEQMPVVSVEPGSSRQHVQPTEPVPASASPRNVPTPTPSPGAQSRQRTQDREDTLDTQPGPSHGGACVEAVKTLNEDLSKAMAEVDNINVALARVKTPWIVARKTCARLLTAATT